MDGNKIARELSALAFLFLAVFLALSLATYSSQDPSLNQHLSPGYEVQNRAGVVGAFVAGLVVDLFGLGSWALPPLALWLGLSTVFSSLRLDWIRWSGLGLIFVCLVSGTSVLPLDLGGIHGGGLLGAALTRLGQTYLHTWGAFVLWLFAFLAGLQLWFKVSWIRTGSSSSKAVLTLGQTLKAWFLDLKKWLGGLFATKAPKPAPQAKKHSAPSPERSRRTAAAPRKNDRPARKAVPAAPALAGNVTEHPYPPLELLEQVQETEGFVQPQELDKLGEKLADCLLEFGIQGEVVDSKPGPVVTMFEFRPAPGVKISRIANLHDDLALALKAMAVRIEAPIPGKDIVGIEIPNATRKTVFFRDVVESKIFQESRHKLPMALGHDIQGHPRVEDLARMPHLLVAGATGAGKSVCLNTIITSLLLRAAPEEMQLLLLDPKRIEMASYGELPHLVHPVVTDMELAKTALDWAVHEMDRRYEAMADFSVRNIEGYNTKLKDQHKKDPESVQELKPMPYLVVIVDELADLMLTAGKEAEAHIVRLAQLARAAGIHLILATQRPSVDVVTGLIKANFPARIAFQVSSKHDSRTILDTVGAQYLLGQGDMLFKSGAGKLNRIHGAFISDQDITSVIDFWKQKKPRPSDLDLKEWKTEMNRDGVQGNGDDISQDPLYTEAVNIVLDQGKGSISMIQRQMRIGFNRAARFIEQMERDGIIGPQEGSKPRTVMK